ncbi:Transcription elongation factor GreA [compost metagenome]
MNHSTLTPGLRESLLNQLVVLGEEKKTFLDAYFAAHIKERSDASQFLADYVTFVEKQLQLKPEEQLATVYIGTEVTIYDMEYKSTDTFEIVYPDEMDPDENRISFLSPLGKQLLMRRIGEVFQVETPSGVMEIRIDNIQYK